MAPVPETTKRRVLAMLAEGKKPQEIMDALGLTRGQVAGIRFRAKNAPKVKIDVKGRAEDEVILLCLAFRRRGISTGKIAKLVGRKAMWVNGTTYAVREHDLNYSGEPAAIVKGAYW